MPAADLELLPLLPLLLDFPELAFLLLASSAVNVGASSSAKASKKPTNAQLK